MHELCISKVKRACYMYAANGLIKDLSKVQKGSNSPDKE